MQSIRNTKNHKNKTLFLVITVLVVLLLGSAYAYMAHQKNWWPFLSNGSNSSKVINESENAADTTYSSEKTKDDNKESTNSSKSPDSSNSNSAKKTIQVGISSATKEGSSLEIRSFATGIIEGNGTCTATLTKDSLKVTGISEAFIDASTTQCEPIEIDIAKLQTGTWKLIVTYDSQDYEGTSSLMEVNI